MPENCNVIMTPENQFVEWIKTLTSWERAWYLNKIALACDMSYQGVYKWATGRNKIRKPFQKVINEVAGKEIITVEQ